MKVAVPLEKYILGPLGITVAASAIDVRIQTKINGLGTTTLILFKRRNKRHNENRSDS